MGRNLTKLRIFGGAPNSGASVDDRVRETPCNLCDGSDFLLAGRTDRRGQPLPTVVCRRCGLVSHLAIPSDQELLRYYQSQYRQDYHGRAVPAAHRVVRAWRNAASLVARLSQFLCPGDAVFEVGAGLGCTVKQFELAGFSASGIEPGTAYQAFSRDQIGADIEPATWSDVAPGPRYNLLLLVHVIEHLNSPRAALAHLRQMLAPGGLLYVECPNLYSPHAAPGRLFHPAHVYNFTPATLGMLCRRSGYEIEREFSQPRDRNLSFLLSRARHADDTLDGAGYAQTIEALSRYNNVNYHLRWGYLSARLQGFARNLSDRWFATRRVAQIVAQCQTAPQSIRRAA